MIILIKPAKIALNSENILLSAQANSNSSGVRVAEERYMPWGESRYTYGTTPTTYKFTGQRVESSFGLYFYNARWYDPVAGWFTSADTVIPEQQGVQAWDRYAYTNNNPVKHTDPSGQSIDCAVEEYNCDAEKYVDAPTADPPPEEKLTTVQRIGKGITYLTIMVFIVFPTEFALMGASITAAAAGPEGIVIDVVLLPLEIAVADFAISYGIKTYNEIESGQNVEFTWTILPAIASWLPDTIQTELHNAFPGIFP